MSFILQTLVTICEPAKFNCRPISLWADDVNGELQRINSGINNLV